MAREKSWLVNLLKKFFLCESDSQPEKKTKRFGWIVGSFKKLKQLPASFSTATTLSEAREEQRKHALNVARATAAAAEAAVTAAQAAAAVVRLTEVPQRSRTFHFRRDKEIHHWAATKFQTAFRGYLARKAFRALKALVRIQAIARGRAVRRRLEIAKLKPLAPSTSTSLPCLRKSQALVSDGGQKWGNKVQPTVRTKIELAEAIKDEREWNGMFTKGEVESMSMRKQEAIYRRERMKQYFFSHRERIDEPLSRRCNERQLISIGNHWAEEKKSVQREEKLENFLPTLHSKPRPASNNFGGSIRLQQRSFWREADFDLADEELQSPFSKLRRSFCHTRQTSSGGYDSNSISASSPIFPSYMAATESAKAKTRSMSTPRTRTRYLDHASYFEHGDSYKNMRSTWSAFNGETISSFAKTGGSQLKSLSMRSLQEP